MRFSLPIAVSIAAVGPALAADVTLRIEVPQLPVAEYHKPYLAIWIEHPELRTVTNLAVWYDADNEKKEGEKWLKDLRQWWRRAGRDLSMPVDGITGATRAPGIHPVSLNESAALAALVPGEYRLVVEAAREVGGREVVQIGFVWPPRAEERHEAKGSAEIGSVVLELKP